MTTRARAGHRIFDWSRILLLLGILLTCRLKPLSRLLTLQAILRAWTGPSRYVVIRHSDGRGQGHDKGDPRPPFAFKMSMINEFCNSHYLLAACCVFHRRTSRVIHHRELFGFLSSIIPHVQTTRAVRGNTLGNILDILKKKYGSASGPRVPNPRQLP